MRFEYDTVELALRTLRIGFESTTIAAVVGVPLGVALGLGRFGGRKTALSAFNAGLRVPPVALGHALWLLMWPSSQWGGGPLSGLGWIYTFTAAILCQTLLALPVIVALTSAAVQAVPTTLLDQARAYGASGAAIAALAVREARVGVLAALTAALGTTMASVGALLIVSNLADAQTLPTATLVVWREGGRNAEAVAYGTAMLGIFLVVAAVLTVVQHGQRPRWLPVRS
ncbi:MAG TPA: ABC transporter permease [Solirubrobacter sp.]